MGHWDAVADGVGPRCPVCESTSTGVTDTRRHDGRIFRQRRCRCGWKFGTVEQVIDQTHWKAVRGVEPYAVLQEGA